MKLIRKIKRWLNIKLSLYHWYEIKVNYRKEYSGEILFNYHVQLGFPNQSTILSERQVKSTLKPLHKSNSPVIRSILCNGFIDIERVCYLGHFSKYS
jgi:hypothetical protein